MVYSTGHVSWWVYNIGVHRMMYITWCTLHDVHHMVYNTWCTVQDISHGEYTAHGVQHMVHRKWGTTHGVQHTMHSRGHISWWEPEPEQATRFASFNWGHLGYHKWNLLHIPTPHSPHSWGGSTRGCIPTPTTPLSSDPRQPKTIQTRMLKNASKILHPTGQDLQEPVVLQVRQAGDVGLIFRIVVFCYASINCELVS